jgi:outer membrane protein OmpA-like peptidoglycan-associated protein
MAGPFKIFIAYSRKDSSYLDELRTHFTPLERSGQVQIWYDGMIEPGVVWEAAIKENLHSADIILLLVSADAIASDYFYDKEMRDALDRHQAGQARVVPLVLRPCAWQATPLGQLQALPQDGKAVSTWPDRDDAYSNAVHSLLAMFASLREQRAAAELAEKKRLERLRQEEAKKQQAQRQPTKEKPQTATTAKSKQKTTPPSKPLSLPPKTTPPSKFFQSPSVWVGALAIAIFFLVKNLWMNHVGEKPTIPADHPAVLLDDTTQQKGTETLNLSNTPIGVATTKTDDSQRKLTPLNDFGVKKKLKCGSEIILTANSGEGKLLAYLDGNTAANPGPIAFDRLIFAEDRATLSPKTASQQLENLATILKCYSSTKIRIGVHADGAGTESLARLQSLKRAANVKKDLANLGIEPERMETVGLSSSIVAGTSIEVVGK